MITQDLQCKKCRRAGEKLFLKGEKCNSAKCPMVKRNFPPGMHGSKGAKRPTNYGQQFGEKQKAKATYGLRERQFRATFDRAFKKVGNTSELFFQLLESRLDNLVYRLGLATSRRQARQLVGHGHVAVNGRKVDIPSYQVKVGDVISLKEKSLKSALFSQLKANLENKSKELLPWLNLDLEKTAGKLTSKPKLADVGSNINWQTIIELYSK